MQLRPSVNAALRPALGALSRTTLALAALFVCVGISTGASAGRVLIRYDANDTFPEEEGWTRRLYDPNQALVRTLESSTLRIDTRGSMLTSDAYQFESSTVAPTNGEQLVLSWRMRTTYSSDRYGSSEVMVGLVNPQLQYVMLEIGTDFVAEDRYAFGYSDYIVGLAPGQFHTYELLTSDFHNYELFVDDSFCFGGDLHWEALGSGPRIAFGDFLVGGVTSVSEWDYIETAIVPEPSSLLACLALLAIPRRVMSCAGQSHVFVR